MRAVVTRVRSASVAIDGTTVGQIGPGFLILLGVTQDDTPALCKKLAEKVLGRLHFNLEQVQDLTPTPMTLSSVMFYTGENPYTHEPVYVARSQEEKRRQKSYFFGTGGKAVPKGGKGPGNGRKELSGCKGGRKGPFRKEPGKGTNPPLRKGTKKG